MIPGLPRWTLAATALLALLGALAACRGPDGCAPGGGPTASTTDPDGPTIEGKGPGPAPAAPERGGFTDDLFLVVDGRPGHSYRVRFGADRPPMVLGADQPTFYDGTSLIRYGRSVNRRTVPLSGGGSFTETRVRLWEDDGLGTGHWIHRHGLMRELDPEFGADCDPATDACAWAEQSGLDLVSITGELRGMREWSAADTGGERGEASVAYLTHDRFGRQQDLIRLYPTEHREMIRAARERWDALDEETRSCYRFHPRSGFLRPAPGGLVWAVHGHALYEACHGTALRVEVPAPPPAFGGVAPDQWGEPGEVFHFLDPELWVEPGAEVQVRFDRWTLAFPGPAEDDPPLAALRWLPEAAILEAHQEPLERAFTELHDLPLLPGPAPEVDGSLADWDDAPLLLLDARTNVSRERHGRTWQGPSDTALAVGVRAADDGWVVAARVHDDVLITDRGGERRDVATDHLQLWLGTDDGWVQVAVYPGAEGAEVVPVALARRGEQEGDVPESAAAAVAGVHAAWRPLQDRQGEALGLDLEVAIPASAVRVEGDRFGLRVVYADSDGGATLEGDLCIGNAPPLADAWVRLE